MSGMSIPAGTWTLGNGARVLRPVPVADRTTAPGPNGPGSSKRPLASAVAKWRPRSPASSKSGWYATTLAPDGPLSPERPFPGPYVDWAAWLARGTDTQLEQEIRTERRATLGGEGAPRGS